MESKKRVPCDFVISWLWNLTSSEMRFVRVNRQREEGKGEGAKEAATDQTTHTPLSPFSASLCSRELQQRAMRVGCTSFLPIVDEKRMFVAVLQGMERAANSLLQNNSLQFPFTLPPISPDKRALISRVRFAAGGPVFLFHASKERREESIASAERRKSEDNLAFAPLLCCYLERRQNTKGT